MNKEKLTIAFLIVLSLLLSILYFNLRTEYLLQNQALIQALNNQNLYMQKYASCLNTQAEMVNWKMEKYERALEYYQRVYKATVMKYKTLPVALGGGR